MVYSVHLLCGKINNEQQQQRYTTTQWMLCIIFTAFRKNWMCQTEEEKKNSIRFETRLESFSLCCWCWHTLPYKSLKRKTMRKAKSLAMFTMDKNMFVSFFFLLWRKIVPLMAVDGMCDKSVEHQQHSRHPLHNIFAKRSSGRHCFYLHWTADGARYSQELVVCVHKRDDTFRLKKNSHSFFFLIEKQWHKAEENVNKYGTRTEEYRTLHLVLFFLKYFSVECEWIKTKWRRLNDDKVNVSVYGCMHGDDHDPFLIVYFQNHTHKHKQTCGLHCAPK